jgi:hypothetical protein
MSKHKRVSTVKKNKKKTKTNKNKQKQKQTNKQTNKQTKNTRTYEENFALQVQGGDHALLKKEDIGLGDTEKRVRRPKRHRLVVGTFACHDVIGNVNFRHV